MFGKKIKFYRLENKMTIEELADKLKCTKAAVSQYENDVREPNMEIINKICTIFKISPLKLLPTPKAQLTFNHRYFRKNRTVTQSIENNFIDKIEDYCKKYIELNDIIAKQNNKPFLPKKLDFNIDNTEAVKIIRKYLSVPDKGPINSICNTIEKLGVIILSFNAGDEIEGCNGKANDYTYIFFNNYHRTLERKRFTLIHEFVHLFFNHLNNIDSKKLENKVNLITGMVLITDEDIYDEFGKTNDHISRYFMELVAKKYMIAPSCLVKRLFDLSIVKEMYYRNFFKFMNAKYHSRKNEPTLLNGYADEKPIAFESNVYRALSNELITTSKASELLHIPLGELVENLNEA